MDIIILADFCGDFSKNGNSRFLYLADLLKKDHEVEIITGDFNHGRKEYFSEPPMMEGYTVTMLHEGAYPKNISLQRFAGHYLWGKNVRKYLNTRKKPDVIFAAMPTLKAAAEAARYCEKNNIRFVVDIQDLWPEAYQMVFHVPVISSLVFSPFKRLAEYAYKRANVICAVSQTYVDRAKRVNTLCERKHVVFLGTNLETFDNNAELNPVQKEDPTKLWLAYCGTLGNSYDLITVIDALDEVKRRGIEPPTFIIMGEGPRRTEFEQYAAKKNVDAVFTGKLPYSQMCGRLKACDITVNPIVKGSAASIINKHADYAASGLPVLNTQESKEYRALVDEYKMGFNCNNGDAGDLADKLIHLVSDPALRDTMGQSARRCAEERFDRRNSYRELIDAITRGV